MEIELELRKERHAKILDSQLHAEEIALWREDQLAMHAMAVDILLHAEETVGDGWLKHIFSPYYDRSVKRAERLESPVYKRAYQYTQMCERASTGTYKWWELNGDEQLRPPVYIKASDGKHAGRVYEYRKVHAAAQAATQSTAVGNW